jgi:hypothetical protein
MVRGRIEREVRQVINQRGLPYNEKMFQKMKKEKYEALMRSTKSPLQPTEDDTYAESFSREQVLEAPVQPQQRSVEIREKCSGPLVLSVEVDEGRIEKLVIREGECYKEVAAKFIQDMSTH